MSLRVLAWLKGEAAILVVAFGLRLGVALLIPVPDGFETLSEPGRIAANLVGGRGYSFDFYGTRPDRPLLAFVPPLHPALIALSLRFSRPALALGIAQAVLGTATVGFLARLAGRLGGRVVGVLAGWMAALYPAHVLVTSQPISVALFACLLIGTMVAAFRLLEVPSNGRALAVGSLIGLYGLGRSQALLLLPTVLVWLALNQIRGRQLLRLGVALVAAAAVVLLPWALRNGLVLGWFVPTATSDGVTFWNGNNPFTSGSGHDVVADKLAAFEGLERDPALPDVYEHAEPYPFPPELEGRIETISELELRRDFYRASLAYIREQPADWLKLLGRKLLSFWWFRPNLGANPLYRDLWTKLYRVQYALVLPVAGVGFGLSLRRGLARPAGLLTGVLVYTTLIHVTYHVLTRYRWEIELLLLIFVAVAVDVGWRSLRKRPETI